MVQSVKRLVVSVNLYIDRNTCLNKSFGEAVHMTTSAVNWSSIRTIIHVKTKAWNTGKKVWRGGCDSSANPMSPSHTGRVPSENKPCENHPFIYWHSWFNHSQQLCLMPSWCHLQVGGFFKLFIYILSIIPWFLISTEIPAAHFRKYQQALWLSPQMSFSIWLML